MIADVLDTVEKCQSAVAQLFQEKEVAIDIEGVELGRKGELCLIQMFGSSSPCVYLFDITVLGSRAFKEGGLQDLLEAGSVTKLFYDVRGDGDALEHLYGVKVKGAYDIQVLWHVRFQHPDDGYLQGLKAVQVKFLEESKLFTPRTRAAMNRVKAEGQALFVPDLGGDYRVWAQRPLSAQLLQYAAADATVLLEMRSYWAPKAKPGENAELDSVVKNLSDLRLHSFLALPDRDACDQAQKKRRDFPIPQGFNSTGVISSKLPVASDKRGLLIGKKGATRQAIEESTGARLILDDGNPYVLIIGLPRQIDAAARKIQAKIA